MLREKVSNGFSFNKFKLCILLITTVGLFLGSIPGTMSNEAESLKLNTEITTMELGNLKIVNDIYTALNDLDVKPLEEYLSNGILVQSLHNSSPPLEGKDAIIGFFTNYFATAKNIKFEFISGPYAMGDIVTVEYINYYELQGNKRSDHNVSIFIIENKKIKKWLGYIHPAKP